MGKIFKIIGIVVGALVLLAVLAITILPMVIPWDSILTTALEEGLGRKATVEDVSVSLWGGLEADVRGLEVADKPAYGQRPLIKLTSLKVEAALWPLFTNTLLVERVQVDGLELSVVRGKDGRLNWSDVPAREKGKAPGQRREAEHPDEDEGHFVLSSLQVQGSKLWLRNLTNGMQSELPLQRCEMSSDLTIGRASGQVSLALPGFSLESTAKSRGYDEDFVLEQASLGLKLDLAQLAARLAPLFPGIKARGGIEITGQASGPAKALKVQAQGQARDLWLQTKAMGKGFFKLSEAQLGANLTLDLPGELVRVQMAQFNAPTAGMAHNLSGVLGWGKSLGKSDALYQQQTDLAKLARVLSPLLPWPVQASGLASKRVRFKGAGPGVLEISGQNQGKDIVINSPQMAAPFRDPSPRAEYEFLIKEHQIEIKRLDIACRAARLGLTGKLAREDNKALVRLTLKGQHLDLDLLPLGPPPARQKIKAPKAKPKAAAQDKAKTAAPKTARAGVPEPAQIRRDLQNVDAEALVSLGRLRARGYEFKDLSFTARVKKAKAELKDFKAGFLQGKLAASAGVDFNPSPPASRLTVSGQGLKLTPPVFRRLKDDFLVFALPLSGLSGIFSLETDVAGSGLSAQALAASLKGKGSLKARDGVTIELAFLDQAEGIDRLWQQAMGQLPRRFAKFEGTYTVGKGRVNYDIALMAGADEMDAQILGSTGLLDDSLDATVKFKADTVGHTLRQFLAPDGTFPIKLGGTIHRPVPKLVLTGSPAEKAVEGILKGLFNR